MCHFPGVHLPPVHLVHHFQLTLLTNNCSRKSCLSQVGSSKSLNVGVHVVESYILSADFLLESCYFHLRRLKQIRRYVEPDVIHSLVHAFVTSHLDYCNAYTVRRLQWVQNTAARLVLDVPHSSLSQPLLRELHWLPIESCIKFKLCVLI